MMQGVISFDPILPLLWLMILCLGATLITAVALWRGLPGWWLRALGLTLICGALANPVVQNEDRTGLSNIAVIVVDDSTSQHLAERRSQTGAALTHLQEELDAISRNDGGSLEWRVVRSDGAAQNGDAGTYLIAALEAALAEIPAERFAGAILITDGQVHDTEQIVSYSAPIHILLTGQLSDWDRRIVVDTVPSFGIVGESVSFTLHVDQDGDIPLNERGPIPLTVQLGSDRTVQVMMQPGVPRSLTMPIDHAGANVLELSVQTGQGEVTGRNNQVILNINGIRDRLRVLLVSGEPHPGTRTWRNLLKADASVDLVHFTILRPPDRPDLVPAHEMSLIAFPTRELFLETIDEFDLIIFDRFRRRGVLPAAYLQNIVRYVEEGGAVLVASGPSFAGAESLARTPLQQILPALPTAGILEEGYVPQVSEIGTRHPVTEPLSQMAEDEAWGRWFRLIDTEAVSGQTIMQGPDERPLLVLDRPGQGRIAMLASDHAWLWSRGYEGGGPQQELLRRLAHWLMQEPELEEEVLTARADGSDLIVERRTLQDDVPAIEIETPSGQRLSVPVQQMTPGRWIGRLNAMSFTAEDGADQTIIPNGIYHLTDGDLNALAVIGSLIDRELEQVLATEVHLAPIAGQTGGAVNLLHRSVPDIRLVRQDRSTSGRGWVGLVDRAAYQVEDIRLTPLAPGWLFLLLAALFVILGWRREGR